MIAAAALRAGVAALLSAQGDARLAEAVRAAQVELVGPGEAWSLDAREVTAQRVALIVPAEAFARLTGDAAARAAVRAAFAEAMRSPQTELLELHLELLLPGIERAWGRAYREAPLRDVPASRPDPAAILAGASALLEAAHEHEGAAMLRGATLEESPVEGASVRLVRVVVRLGPEERARTWRQPELEDRLRRAVHDAACRAAEQVVVELGVTTAS